MENLDVTDDALMSLKVSSDNQICGFPCNWGGLWATARLLSRHDEACDFESSGLGSVVVTLVSVLWESSMNGLKNGS